ncbi:hypothetical protein [Bdellovibrio sp. HCB288]|uniref:hypothetical protein n=1 Tax=Bdellovibrio sp. HCB288 TaxID=3394355 RepID=UPI0039B61FEF
MQKIIFFLSFLAASIASANACPQLTGLYQMAEGAVVKYESDGCERLIRWSGFTTKKGEIVISPEKTVYSLDGTPQCSGQRCQSPLVVENVIQFSLNYDGYVKSNEHGLCMHREYTIAVNTEGNLQTAYQVRDCDDGFSGEATKVFPRLPNQ